jgi:MoxR-like ATPase
MQTDGTPPNPITLSTEQTAPAGAQSAHVAKAAEAIERLKQTIGLAMVGQSAVVEQVIVTLIASGHALIEGVPGLGKTLLVRALAQALSLNHARVQFTPDLMPSDITGHAILDPNTRELRVVKGPIFTQLLLADEINRAPAKTQSALLETMQEYQVTLEGQTHRVPQPFFVLATENPVESEGTYPLPEAQLDRFLLKIDIGYPTQAEEAAIVVRTTTNQSGNQLPLDQVKPCLNERGILSLQQIASRQRVDDAVVDYAVRIVRATRESSGIAVGASSRGAIALVRAARVIALMEQREFVTPDDIKRIALPALRHRIALSPDAMLEGRKTDHLLQTVLDTVAAPRA